MKEVKGNLTNLGTARVTSDHHTTYSVIEIGNQVLTDVQVNDKLETFLKKAYSQEGETTLYLSMKGGAIAGIRMPDGHFYTISGYRTKTAVIIGLIMLPMGLMGAPILLIAAWYYYRNAPIRQLKAMGATALG